MNFRTETAYNSETVEINLTPLIDIVFLLLIFFMVSTTFIDANRINIDLPKASSAASPVEKEPLTISIKKDGNYFIGQQQVSLTELNTQLKDQAAKDNSTLVIIRADKGTEHGKVVSALDAAKAAGLSQLGIATEEQN